MTAACVFRTKFTERLGDTNEKIVIKISYGADFDGDGFKDVKVQLKLAGGSNSGTEDLIGVAFDVTDGADPLGLTVKQIKTATANGTLSSFTPPVVQGDDQVSDGGPLDPGFSTSGTGSDEPYDIGIKFSETGSGEGIVQSARFTLTQAGTDLDASTLLSNTDWLVRLQSTNGGEGSARTGGFVGELPPCRDEPEIPTFENAISNIVIYADCDGAAGSAVTKIKFDDFDVLSAEIFTLDLAQLEDALDAAGHGDCAILGVTVKAGAFQSGLGPGEGAFIDLDLDDDSAPVVGPADVTFEAADFAGIFVA